MKLSGRGGLSSHTVVANTGESTTLSRDLALARDFAGGNLVRDHFELRHRARSEAGHDRDVGRVASARHQDAADAGAIVAGIECVPVSPEIDLEPCTEIHGLVDRRYADVAEIAGAVARRNIHAATQRDGKMRKIATYALFFHESIPCRLGRARMFVTERQMVVHVIADFLDKGPTLRCLLKQGPSGIQ